MIEAGNAASFDDNATVEQALEKLGLQTQYDLLPGMEVALMPHQTIGVAWMLEKEKSSYKGGSLGDDMGLGKVGSFLSLDVWDLWTWDPFRPSRCQFGVSTNFGMSELTLSGDYRIATLVKNRSDDPMCKTNLIITPAALLDQWKMEVEIKTNCDLNVLVYHGGLFVRFAWFRSSLKIVVLWCRFLKAQEQTGIAEI